MQVASCALVRVRMIIWPSSLPSNRISSYRPNLMHRSLVDKSTGTKLVRKELDCLFNHLKLKENLCCMV